MTSMRWSSCRFLKLAHVTEPTDDIMHRISSISQADNQSFNHSIIQSFNQSINQSINQLLGKGQPYLRQLVIIRLVLFSYSFVCVLTSRCNIHGNRMQGVKPDDVHFVGRMTWETDVWKTLTIGLRGLRLLI